MEDKLSRLFTTRLSATGYMKVKRMGITEILRRIWLFAANKIKSSESFSKQPTQLIVELNSISCTALILHQFMFELSYFLLSKFQRVKDVLLFMFFLRVCPQCSKVGFARGTFISPSGELA